MPSSGKNNMNKTIMTTTSRGWDRGWRSSVVVDDNYQDDFDEDESLDVYISGFNFHFHHRVPNEEK